MPLARLFAATLLASCAPLIAQVQKPTDALTDPAFTAAKNQTSLIVSPSSNLPERWNFIPEQRADLGSNQDALSRIRVDQYRVEQYKVAPGRFGLTTSDATLLSDLKEQPGVDSTCYAIRSYVVARDSKDSDSTHPTGYSTCRPSDRYHVKSAEIRVVTGDR